jgi:glycosyltransferase involved in cell wall biosynthesis
VRIIFINRYFYPDHSATSQMVSDLAFALAAKGHAVAVIASRQLYDAPEARLPRRETQSLEVHRVWTSRFGRHNLFGRAIDYASFYAAAAWKLWRLAGRHSVIVAKTDPPMLSLVAAPIARARRAHLVNWMQDIFPEIAETVGVGRSRLARTAFRVLRVLRDRSLRGAAANVVVGERMACRLDALGVGADRIRLIPNWADGSLVRPLAPSINRLRSAWGLDHAFVVGYSGNLGRAHEYETLLEAIAALEERRAAGRPDSAADPDVGGTGGGATPEIKWLFIGGGALYCAFEDEVCRRGLKSVQFRPYQPRERLSESLSAADVHLVSLRPALEGLVVPSKFYGIAAAGRPAIFIGAEDGEIARLIADYRCGRRVAERDGAGLARTILELAADPAACRRMEENARRAFEREFDKSIAVERWAALLQEVAANSRSTYR